MPPLNLLIKPSSGMCNLRCEYCFYHDVSENREQPNYGFMSENTLENILIKAFAFADGTCSFAFQGGEPTLIGLPFYEKLIELQKKYNKKQIKIFNVIQTNGYQLPEEWAIFFAKHNFLVGISVDGTKHIHDAFRKNPEQAGSFLSIMKTIDTFEQNKVEYNILTVVTNKIAKSIDKVYKYYKKMNFLYLQFIPCLDPLYTEPGSLPYSLTPQLYGTFLCRLFDLWYDDFMHGYRISIRQFDNYILLLKNNRAEACDMNGFCSIQNVIESDGEVYPCDFFVLDEYKLGNLNEVTFKEINEKRRKIEFVERSLEKDEDCRRCQYFPICRGGCTRHRAMAGSFSDRNYFCESYKMFFEHCLSRLIEVTNILIRQ